MYEAIKRLRELLTERGIKYEVPYASDDTYWNVNGIRWCAFESAENTLWIVCNSDVAFTPEQVIAMTVGEECEMHICKRCGVAYELNIIDKGFGKPRFCPNCGHREMHQ